jgi:hypothetical protein
VSEALDDRRKVGLSVSGRLHDAVIAQAGREDRSASAVYERAVRLYLRALKRKSERGATAPR